MLCVSDVYVMGIANLSRVLLPDCIDTGEDDLIEELVALNGETFIDEVGVSICDMIKGNESNIVCEILANTLVSFCFQY